jgi:hypothetical protein
MTTTYDARLTYKWIDGDGDRHVSVCHYETVEDAFRQAGRAFSPTSDWSIERRRIGTFEWEPVAR